MIPRHLQIVLEAIKKGCISAATIEPEIEMGSYNGPGIYAIVNKKSGLLYIGLSEKLRKRKIAHLYGLRNKKHRNTWLQDDFNLQGEGDFMFIILEKVDVSLLNEREQFYMDTFEYKYNVILFSDRRLFTDQHKKNLSIAHIGAKHTEESKKKIGAASKGNKYRLGIPLGKEHKEKILAAFAKTRGRKGADNPLFGKPRDPAIMERVVKTRMANYGNSCPRNYKKVIQYDLSASVIKEWDSIKNASISLGIGPSRISEACSGKRKSVGGFIFKLKDNEKKDTVQVPFEAKA